MSDLPPTGSGVEFVGPFEETRVVVDGWQVPFLEADLLPGGRVLLCLDKRLAMEVAVAEADETVRFVADAIAIARGFSCHPRADWPEAKPLPPYRHLTELGSVVEGEPTP